MNDVVERVVRDLIRNNQLSRARAVLSLFQDEYPHLLLELEAASGNWRMVPKIYERLSGERKEEYKTLYKTAVERVKADYVDDVKEAFEEISKNNFEGGMAILESVSKAYPELSEAIALKLELARRKKDKARAKIYEEALKKIDASHPLLVTKPEKVSKSTNTDIVLLVGILATLVLALVGVFLSLSQSSRMSGMNTEIVQLKDQFVKLDSSVAEIKNSLLNFERIFVLEEKIDRNSQQISNSAERILEVIQSMKFANSEELKALKEELTKLLAASVSKQQRLNLVLSKDLDAELSKSLWLFGYRLYKAGYYQDAYTILNNVSSILSGTGLYFEDDAYYYMALSVYEAGDIATAKEAFRAFLSIYPNSEYAPHARYFLTKVNGR
ncbi:tetratricopeptide repeat protein [Pseudothermotoga sp. U03pept]|uniref:tetratricopeptide repeat protein n=1 Tax=Pseudothermotoga sp. U03pept TaxID=3447012 RepID=UPI003F0368A7